jgi:cell division protein FtsW
MSGLRPLALAALLALCALQLVALLRAPAAWMPSQVAVTLERGAALALPSSAVGAPAEAQELRLRRGQDGSWWASAGGRAIVLEREGRRRRSGSVLLAPGQRFQLGAGHFRVDAVDAAGVSFSRGTARWRYDGATLLRDGAAQAACPETRSAARLAASWNRLVPAPLALARPLVFGGNLDCGNRIAIAGLDAPAATIARSSDGLLLSAPAGDAQAPLLLDDGPAAAPLAERELPLDDGAALILGRTRLHIQRNGDVLHLQPGRNVALYTERERRLPPGVSWSWTRRGHWDLPAGTLAPALGAMTAAAVLAALAALGRARRQPWRARWPALAGAPLAACGLVLLWLQRAGTPAGAGLALLAAWGALALALFVPRRLPLLLAAGVPLLGLGLLAQLDLGLAAPASSWLRHFQKSAALLALGGGVCAVLGALRPALPLQQARVEALLVLLAGLALALLLLQVVFGDETGVFDLQPVEFAKLALAALSAHCLALAAGSGPAPGGRFRRSLRLVMPALLFMVLLGVALVQVDDYSPLILLALWGGAMALAHALATRQRGAALFLMSCAGLAVAAVVALRGAGPGEIAQWNFYADRFLVWLDPGTHPHTGQQLLLGARAIADGGWLGTDRLLGLSSLGRDAGPALHIPAVQDDFAASFFLNRHGLAAALALWLLQAGFLAGLLAAAVRCWLAGARTRDFRLAWLARFRCFLLCGGAAFVFGHFLLSWGTNLAIFPVMGQPMSFLSAGGSHLLFFIVPLLAFGAASAQSLEEPHHAANRTQLCSTRSVSQHP